MNASAPPIVVPNLPRGIALRGDVRCVGGLTESSPQLWGIRAEKSMMINGAEAQIEAGALSRVDLPSHPGELSTCPDWWLGYPEIPAQRTPDYALAKRVLDILGAIAIGVAFSPLILAVVLFMHFQDGPILFRHRRIGRGGRSFECLKFRTMVPNADRLLRELLERDPCARAEWFRDHKLRADPRVTAWGCLLRRASVDELPQLWNVLRGEMSLVGPRPIVQDEMLRYGRYLQAYLAVSPGITGLWQVMGRNDTDYRRRVALDVYYVRKRSLLMDLYIIFQTARVVVKRHGAY